MGQKNHELVPMQLIDSIAGLKHGAAYRCLKTLLQHKLVHHEGHKYDGYRLTYMGYDFLAIRALVARGHIAGVGRQIGVGKESDIFEVTNDEGEVFALKLHRLGRTSFRDVKSKRDYLGTRSSFSWLYLSRLAALKEYAFMKALGDHGFPVPVAIDNNRHAVLMELVDGQPLVQVRELAHPAAVYAAAMELISRLAASGLIHCDFNEFNLLIDGEEALTLIDFPQMVSVGHANARELFERDVDCVLRCGAAAPRMARARARARAARAARRGRLNILAPPPRPPARSFFNKKIGYMPQLDDSLAEKRPSFDAAVARAAAAGASGLDVELAASGFKREHAQALQAFLDGGEPGAAPGSDDGGDGEASGSADEASGSGSGSASGSGDESGGEEAAAGCSGGPAAEAEADGLARQLAGASCSGGPAEPRQQQQQQQQQHRGGRGAASTHRWLEQHAAGAAAGDAVAAAAAGAAGGSESGGGGSSSSGGEGSSSGGEDDEPRRSAGGGGGAAAARQWEGQSVAPSRAATDVSFMGREVQQRLVAQRQRAAARAAAVKASRNVSKAKGKKAKKTAAAMADW
ncbi:rio2 [Scenedesmus sp. PABB004]|nr:rio2 [Scenedesmus sp. PABB004]